MSDYYGNNMDINDEPNFTDNAQQGKIIDFGLDNEDNKTFSLAEIFPRIATKVHFVLNIIYHLGLIVFFILNFDLIMEFIVYLIFIICFEIAYLSLTIHKLIRRYYDFKKNKQYPFFLLFFSLITFALALSGINDYGYSNTEMNLIILGGSGILALSSIIYIIFFILIYKEILK